MRSAATLLLSPFLAAQTFVVDRGGGGQFTDLPPAIAAVPSGAVLRVRPGTYSQFSVQNKSLSILGDAPDSVVVDLTGDVTLGPLAATDKILLHNLRCLAPPLFGGGRLLVQNAAGQVILDHVTVTATPPLFGAPRVEILGCTNVHVLDCTFPAVGLHDSADHAKCEIQASQVEFAGVVIEGEPGVTTAFGDAPGNPGLSAAGSTLFLHGTNVTGGAGAPAAGCGLPTTGPTAGGIGCVLAGGSTLDLVAGRIQGGAGGSGLPCRPAGARGGAGADVTGSVLRTAGAVLAGGNGGATGGQAGSATILRSGGSVVALTAAAATATLRGVQGLGQIVRCSLGGRQGDLAILMFGYDQVVAPVPLLAFGALQVLPVLALGGFVVPAGGVLDVPIAIPGTWPLDQWIPFQFVVVSPTLAEITASNAAAILVKS